MKIIGHRGAAGLALENTLAGIEVARLLGVDAIEIDVRKTKDDVLVLCHDADLKRTSDSSEKVGDLTFDELQEIILNDGESTVPSLHKALKTAGKTPVIIELKSTNVAKELHKVLADFPALDVTVVSFKLDELRRIRDENPNIRLFGLEHTKPFDIIQWAHIIKLNGVGLNFWLLNPLTYMLLKRRKLSIYAYTVNSRLLARFLQFLYPDVAICTDHPELFINRSWTKLRKIRGKQERRKIRTKHK